MLHICPSHAVKSPLRVLSQCCKRLSPLLAAPAALLLLQGQAKAILTYNIFESAGNVVVQTSGSLDLTGASTQFSGACGNNGAIFANSANICTGPDVISPFYDITGPISFSNGTAFLSPASSVSGTFTQLLGAQSRFYIGPGYVSNTPIVSSATFNGTDLTTLGFTTTGLIGTWQLDGVIGSDGQINVVIGAPSAAAVPGPLPLLGAGAAFGWSRRLRKRITTPLITPPQA